MTKEGVLIRGENKSKAFQNFVYNSTYSQKVAITLLLSLLIFLGFKCLFDLFYLLNWIPKEVLPYDLFSSDRTEINTALSTSITKSEKFFGVRKNSVKDFYVFLFTNLGFKYPVFNTLLKVKISTVLYTLYAYTLVLVSFYLFFIKRGWKAFFRVKNILALYLTNKVVLSFADRISVKFPHFHESVTALFEPMVEGAKHFISFTLTALNSHISGVYEKLSNAFYSLSFTYNLPIKVQDAFDNFFAFLGGRTANGTLTSYKPFGLLPFYNANKMVDYTSTRSFSSFFTWASYFLAFYLVFYITKRVILHFRLLKNSESISRDEAVARMRGGYKKIFTRAKIRHPFSFPLTINVLDEIKVVRRETFFTNILSAFKYGNGYVLNRKTICLYNTETNKKELNYNTAYQMGRMINADHIANNIFILCIILYTVNYIFTIVENLTASTANTDLFGAVVGGIKIVTMIFSTLINLLILLLFLYLAFVLDSHARFRAVRFAVKMGAGREALSVLERDRDFYKRRKGLINKTILLFTKVKIELVNIIIDARRTLHLSGYGPKRRKRK